MNKLTHIQKAYGEYYISISKYNKKGLSGVIVVLEMDDINFRNKFYNKIDCK